MGKRDNRVVSNKGSSEGRQQRGPGQSGGRRRDPSQARRSHLRASCGGEVVGRWALPQSGQPHRRGGLGEPGQPASVFRPPGEGRRGRSSAAGEKRPPCRRACATAGGRLSRAGWLRSVGTEGPPDLGAPRVRQQRPPCPADLAGRAGRRGERGAAGSGGPAARAGRCPGRIADGVVKLRHQS